jgi:DNA (cytosine-5)-methyltransferase 1
MRFGSVCSGIEAASVAWHPLGWKAAWLSEIEPFPSAVLKHHYPDVPNLGDMTLLPERILLEEVEAPDVFCGGTPCQAFSVAGLRNSLDDARGNLSLTFVGIANAIDHVRSVRSDDPAIIFWENVPGVLSTKDNAFGCFLGALAGEDDPIIPSGGKWTNAGCVYGPQRAVAWRVLDAQYFGVAQRRRRVFVVASARADFDPASVLFEFDGVRRDTAPGRETREDVAGTIAARFGISRNNHEECISTYSTPAIGNIVSDDVSSCIARNTGSGGETQNPAFVVQKKKWPADIASTLDTTFGTKQGLEDQHVNAGCPLFVPAQPMAYTTKMHNTTSNQAGKFYEEYSTSLDANSPPPAVFQPIPFDTTQITSPANYSKPQAGDPCHPLAAGAHPPAVAQPITFSSVQSNQGINADLNVSQTLEAKNPMAVMHSIIGGVDYENNAHGPDDVTGPLLKGSPTGGGRPLPAIAYNVAQPASAAFKYTMGAKAHGIGYAQEQSPTLDTKADSNAVLTPSMAVRRLTPVECERLQGFPDNYTNIPWRKKDESPDGPRYKALGNSWAVPVVRWIGKRIQEQINAA